MNLKILQSPVLIFGGPYGNLQATSAMKDIAEQKDIEPQNTICTGDIIAYCGNPEETANLIREWGCHVVMGNCEESVGYEKDDCGCGFEQGSVCATLSTNWYGHAVSQVSQDNKLWMQSLPREIFFDLGALKFAVIHGGIDNISEYIFESSAPGRKYYLTGKLGSNCVIGGHCGIPFGQSLKNRYWLNPGVVGMPANDGQTHSWYMILNLQDSRITASWHQLEFNNQDAISAMANAGLPGEYQLSLANGLWPSMSILPEYERCRQGIALNPAPLILT